MMGTKNPAATGRRRDSRAGDYTPSLYARKLDAEDIARMCDRAKRIGSDRWRACCPVHGGHSLQITQKPGIVLLHCWAGCDYREIISALGLESHQLNQGARPPRSIVPGSSLTRAQVAELLDHEWRIAMIAIHDLTSFKPISEEDAQRAILACKRIKRAQEVLR